MFECRCNSLPYSVRSNTCPLIPETYNETKKRIWTRYDSKSHRCCDLVNMTRDKYLIHFRFTTVVATNEELEHVHRYSDVQRQPLHLCALPSSESTSLPVTTAGKHLFPC
jgi:hypothetical protein